MPITHLFSVNQDVINAMTNLFEEQKQFITEEFEKQKAFIEEQFDEAIAKIGNIITAEKLSEIKTQSIAVLHYIEEKQAYLFEIDPQQELTSEELTRVTTDLQLLDNTKDTAIIRDIFVTICRYSALD